MTVTRKLIHPNPKTALVDGDVLVYSNGFATQQTLYVCSDGRSFEKKADAKLHQVLVCMGEEEDISAEVIPEPLSHPCSNIKKQLTRICTQTGAKDYVVYLSGKTNFRVDVDPEYKANRKGAPKPYHYDAIRDYLISVHKATVTDGEEADDALGIHQYSMADEAETVIATIDKDLDMIPGWHYNWQKDLLYWVSEETATRNFYTQLLVGDPVDNIKGCKGIGPKKAAKILSSLATPEDMMCAVGFQYALKYDDPEEELTKNYNLLWIRREEDDDVQ